MNLSDLSSLLDGPSDYWEELRKIRESQPKRDPKKNPDDLKAYCYTPEEQEALRKVYAEDDESGSVLS